jgi:DNA-binding transcriptional LysR family regulator
VVPADAAWNGLELRHLVALVAVADEGSISRAAVHLGYTQSAVSQQVAALERAVGAPVFDRPGGPRPLTLTEAGATLLEHARAVLGRLRAAEADVRSVLAGEHGVLRVGTVQSVGTRVLPDVLRRFHVERPQVEVSLRESHDPAILLQLVADGELDATFCELPLASAGFAHEEVLVDPILLLAPIGSPEAARRSVPATELADLPMIGYRNSSCSALVDACFEAGIEPRIVFRSDDNTTIQGCVGAGLGYALVPLLAVDVDDPAVRVLAIDPPPPPRVVCVAWSADRRPPASLEPFLACVRETCGAIAAGWSGRKQVPA